MALSTGTLRRTRILLTVLLNAVLAIAAAGKQATLFFPTE